MTKDADEAATVAAALATATAATATALAASNAAVSLLIEGRLARIETDVAWIKNDSAKRSSSDMQWKLLAAGGLISGMIALIGVVMKGV